MNATRKPELPATIQPPGGQWPGQGSMLIGRYRLDEHIATGSAATVWRAHDVQLRRDVAIKLLLPHRCSDEVAVGRFRVEALATARATHPNAVRVYDAATDGSLAFLVMEFVDGPTLAALPGPHEPDVVAAVGAQAGAALGAAHARGLVHRDVKPANLLVDATGWVKVVDFGIARVLDEPSGLTLPHMGVGTARYVAPEVLTQEEVGAWTDVYGLGLTLWELLVGRHAFEADNVHALALMRLEQDVPPVRDLIPDAPTELADVIERCTRRNSRDRYPDGDAVATALAVVSGPRPYMTTRRLLGPRG